MTEVTIELKNVTKTFTVDRRKGDKKLLVLELGKGKELLEKV